MFRKTVSWTVLALLVLGWAFTLRPVALGGPASYVMVTGSSMEPHFHDGDLVVLRAADDYAVGDVVTFPVPKDTPGAGALVIHRIIGGTPEAFTIQGDNNAEPDDWTPGEADLLGAEWFLIPRGGVFLRLAMDPTLLAAVTGGFITIYILMKPTSSRKPDQSPADDDSDNPALPPLDDAETDPTPREVQHA